MQETNFKFHRQSNGTDMGERTMKLYDFGPAVNAQRVCVYLAETGVEVPIQELNC
ncbi:MAG: hypothetical protein JJ897_00235 [Marinibacterium sp.]|nr:hypothetical protein [Marinibacterium sp.]